MGCKGPVQNASVYIGDCSARETAKITRIGPRRGWYIRDNASLKRRHTRATRSYILCSPRECVSVLASPKSMRTIR